MALAYGKDRIWRELWVTNVRLEAVQHAKIDKCITGKRSDAELIIYYNLV